MQALIKCVAFKGLETVDINVEVSINPRGLPAFDIVGLPNKSVEESKHRVRSAFVNSGYDFPTNKITVNLAPADLHKYGSFYDLPIAVGIYCAKKGIVGPQYYAFGELSLTGELRHTRGLFLACDHINKYGAKLLIPTCSQAWAAIFTRAGLFPFANLNQLFSFLESGTLDLPASGFASGDMPNCENTVTHEYTVTDVVGQQKAKRALEISAAGGHSLLLIGSPGVGKSMLAKAIGSILPPLAKHELVEIQKIHSYVTESPFLSDPSRPFRAPHHTISYAGMVGGGAEPFPGEITLAHLGILFMDEFCEFSRNVLEALRQPMQDGYVSLSRKNVTYTFPSRFSLIAATNPCPCGYLNHPLKHCVCSEQKIANYGKKLSGPILDRFDLCLSMYDEADFLKQAEIPNPDSLKEIHQRVVIANQLQLTRFGAANSQMTNLDLKQFALLSSEGRHLLNSAFEKLCFSPRVYFKLIKIARTIADLAQCEYIKDTHIAEAIQYRFR